MLGQDRTWVAERAALGTTGHSWATEPGTEAAWLELDLGTRRNVTGECCPQATLNTVLPMVTWAPASRTPPPKTVQSSCNTQEEFELLGPWLYWCKLRHRQCQPPQLSPLPILSLSSPPPSAAISGRNKLILCSCIWCQCTPFVRLELLKAGALCGSGW